MSADMAEHLTTGKIGEDIAGLFLEQSGYKLIARNVANPLGKRLGEIDLVAQKGQEIVFVEVKTLKARPGGENWLPEWRVTQSKLHKLERIAEYFLRKERLEGRAYRFDVVAVILREGEAPSVKHIEHAFYSV